MGDVVDSGGRWALRSEGSTPKVQATCREDVLTVARYWPVASGLRGMMRTALSPARSARSSPDVFAALSTQTSMLPLGPVRVALALVAASGSMAISGRPTVWPAHPHELRGSGCSATKRSSGTVEPSPGKRMGVTVARGDSAEMMSRLAADLIEGFDVSSARA